jgi:hypothetical protein
MLCQLSYSRTTHASGTSRSEVAARQLSYSRTTHASGTSRSEVAARQLSYSRITHASGTSRSEVATRQLSYSRTTHPALNQPRRPGLSTLCRATCRNRTDDLVITSDALYRLS